MYVMHQTGLQLISITKIVIRNATNGFFFSYKDKKKTKQIPVVEVYVVKGFGPLHV